MIDKPEKPRGVADRAMSPKVTPSTASALIASNEVTFYIPSNPFLFALLLTSQGGTMWQNALEPDDVVGSYSGPVGYRMQRGSLMESAQYVRALRSLIPGSVPW